MLVDNKGEEWIAKFPRGSNVDQLLVEHASMELARGAGMNVAESTVIKGGIDHILMVRRFDRSVSGRIHAVELCRKLGDDGLRKAAYRGG
jgi:serine/threonine-protein kinase HipA